MVIFWIVIALVLGSLVLAGVMGLSVLALFAVGVSRLCRFVAERLPSRRNRTGRLGGRQPRGMGPAPASQPTTQGPAATAAQRPAATPGPAAAPGPTAVQRPAPTQAAPRPAPAPAASATRPTPPATPRPRRPFTYLDADGEVTPEAIVQAVTPYQDERVVGAYAHEIVVCLGMADRRRQSLYSQIDREFADSGISWDHFMTTARAALDAIVRNCALLANRVQTFDVEDYARMEQFYRTGGEMRNGRQDPARLERWKLLMDTKAEMDDIRSANEGLLLELDKLSVELDKLAGNDPSRSNAQIADEVRRLVDETKFYR